MAVLMIGEVPNLTEEMYAGMLEQLRSQIVASKGFIAHSGGPNPGGGWRVVEMWETEEDARRWFEESVEPNLPPGVEPNRTYHPVHSAFSA
jgi:hypothetical protein